LLQRSQLTMIRSMEPSIYETSSSLIQRLGNQEPRAWRDFSTKYAWMMRRWLRSWKIPIDQVDDILQETCLRVFRSVHTFERQGHGSFRAWLKEVSRSCWFQVVRKSAYKARMECRHFELESFLSDESLFLIDHQIDSTSTMQLGTLIGSLCWRADLGSTRLNRWGFLSIWSTRTNSDSKAS
jgi:hypothetical protein